MTAARCWGRRSSPKSAILAKNNHPDPSFLDYHIAVELCSSVRTTSGGHMAFPSSRWSFAATFVIATLVPSVSAQRGGVDPRAGGPVDLPSAGSPISERNTDPRSVFISGKVILQGGGPAGRVAI